MLRPKPLQKIRITAALIVAILCIAGFLGLFYPVKIFNFNLVPLIQKIIIDFTVVSGILLLLLIAITLIFGRIYCSTICPLGLLQEFFLLLFRRKKLPAQKNTPFKYFLAALTFGSLLGGTAVLMRLIDPYSVSGTAAGGALYGICILTAIALLTWLKGRFFCTNICPVGAVLGLMSRFSLNKININPDACVACGLCAQKCPSGCIDFKNKTVDNETCIKCFKCLSLCHNHGIFYGSTPKHRNSQPFNPGRRRFIAGTAAMVLFATAFKGGLNLSKGIARKVKNIIVPPGAVSADRLAEKCLNCNLCVTNCPMKIIKKADNEFPAVHIKYQKSFCDYNCNKCSEVCPSGAIRSIALPEKQKTQIGLAAVNEDSCIQCGLCVMECPRSAITKPQGEFPQINPGECIGCGACQAVCPVSAIKVGTVNRQKILNHKQDGKLPSAPTQGD